MQKLIALILLIAFAGQTFSQGLLYVDYAIDRAAYEKNCINKARPQMLCNGKCQLMKKILEREKKEQQQAPELRLAAKIEIIPTSSSLTAYKPFLELASGNSYPTIVTESPVDQPSSVFHPPNA